MAFGSICVCLFQEYGDIEYCVIIKNKSTGESKGLGYVRYYKPSQAAQAIENCDKSKIVKMSCSDLMVIIMMIMRMSLAYRAILAEPRSKASSTEDYSGGASRSDYVGGGEAMNQYALPLGMKLSDILVYYLSHYHTTVVYKNTVSCNVFSVFSGSLEPLL